MAYNQNDIQKKACISIEESSDRFLIKSNFRLFNRFNGGLVLFCLLGIGIIYIACSSNAGSIEFVLIFGIGLILFLAGLFGIIAQSISFVLVNKDQIIFRNGLKTKKFTLHSSMKVQMTARTEESRTKGQTFYTRCLDFYLKMEEEEFRIFNFIVEDEDAREADILGAKITRKIRRRIYEKSIKPRNLDR